MDHMKAIQAGQVTKSTVIGLRKAINADWRREHGYSVGCTAPKLQGGELAAIEFALAAEQPRVTGPLHDSGLALLRSPRYRKRLESVRAIIDAVTEFRLVRFERIGSNDSHCVPVFKALSPVGWFTFLNIPWQSGGNGPEILES